MTHTPGPWHLWSSKDGGFTISAGYQDEAVICQRSDWDHRATESVDNGRLIAACPTMYEYIKQRAEQGDEKASSILGEIHAARRSVRITIAEAEGRS